MARFPWEQRRLILAATNQTERSSFKVYAAKCGIRCKRKADALLVNSDAPKGRARITIISVQIKICISQSFLKYNEV